MAIRDPTQFLFFGGKGGSGKTTCAAATAVALAERGRRVLVVSTDPAHSLGDILRKKLGPAPSRVAVRRGALAACELDADRALERWLTQRRPLLAAIVQRGTILDRTEIDRFLDLSLPGVDEVFGLLEIERLSGAAGYDHVVVDTAPTGHTLRLLATPALFTGLAGVLNAMQEKHRVLAEAFTGQPPPRSGDMGARDAAEALIEELRADGERLAARLRDRDRTALRWVMLPEEMSFAETRRALASLAAEDIHPDGIIVNRVTPPPPGPCALCDGRRASEAPWINAAAKEWRRGSLDLWTLDALDEPPHGVAALRGVLPRLEPLKRRPARRPSAPAARSGRDASAPGAKLPAALRPARSTRLLIVGGKGGVGKTTCAAALALATARQMPARRVLLVSTDPAPSLGDVLGERVGDAEREVALGGGAALTVREIDAARRWREWRDRYRTRIEQAFANVAGPQSDLAVDRVIVSQLFELAPPGMDEIGGMLTILDALFPARRGRRSRFDLVVVDSAPTGHTLRLLAMPAQAHAWVRQLIRAVVKYRLAAGIESLAADLVWLSRGLMRLEKLLTDARACGFIAVSRAEQLVSVETLRLLEWLRGHDIAARGVVVNGVTPDGCARCRRAAARERRQIASFRRRMRQGETAAPVVVTDAAAPPPKGVRPLREWTRSWRELRLR